MKRRIARCWLAVLALTLMSCSGALGDLAAVPTEAAAGAPQLPPVLHAFAERIEVSRAQMPALVGSADQAADRLMAAPLSLVNVPYGPQQSFAEELVNRSGGLANAMPPLDRTKELTEHDVVLFSVRSWEGEGEAPLKLIADYRKRGWLIVLFASQTDAPEDLDVDYLIDNGAPSGGKEHATINAIANVMNGRLWCLEYVAAVTRRGKYPAVLKSAVLPDAEEHNNPIQTREGRHALTDCYTPIPAGSLCAVYMKRVERLVADIASDRVRGQIDTAAGLIAAQLAAGKKVGFATATHFLMSESTMDTRTPWQSFNVVWRAETALPANMKEGDLLVWFSFSGLSSPYEDYGKFIRQTGCDFITSFVPDPNPDNNAPDALCHIDQSWEMGDSEVPVPFPPGKMAPISGLNHGLLYRLLDAASADKLEALQTAEP